MKITFDNTFRDWAINYHIDFYYMSISICKNDNILTLSEYELSTQGEDLWACLYSFYKKKGCYRWIYYDNGNSSEYKNLFGNNENKIERTKLCKVNTRDLVDFLLNNDSEYYNVEIVKDLFIINGTNIRLT